MSKMANRLRVVAKQWHGQARTLRLDADKLRLRADEIEQRAYALDDELDKLEKLRNKNNFASLSPRPLDAGAGL